jgi:CDP-diglyceride synthetase
MQPEKGVLVRFLLEKIVNNNKFTDLKKRFASSVALILFAYVFYVSPLRVSSILLALIYAVLISEWHKASLNNKKLIDIWVFVFITLGVFSFSFINFMRYDIDLFESIAYIPMIWVLFTAILTDIGAYFTGRIIGGYCPFPKISPAKTLSGYLGGLFFGGVFPALTVFLVPNISPSFVQIIFLLMIGGALSIATMAGDLLQSYFKRKNNVKDTGSLLPGHGGLFDRFDGILGASLMLMCIWCLQMVFL